MFFSAEDDDQDFASGGSKSRLANLFGIDKQSSQGGNESLTYTAPKQPRPKEPAPQTEGAPGVLFASAVNAYKYVDGKYASQGKLGAAILANHTSLDYRILLYVSKQQQVTNAKITTAFIFTVQSNNYAIIYDDSRLTWSLNFDSEQNVQLFAKNVALAKALSAGSALETVISQDLNVGEGTSVETGSSVEVKYTGWLLSNNTFGQEFDSNAKSDKMFRFQTGKGKVIKGWDTGVVGMKKGTKRILIVPPSLGYGNKGAGSKIPPNSTLIFEITVIRIKGAKGASPSPSPIPDSTPSPVNDQEEHTVKERTKSISDQLSTTATGKSGKARLISKMAKMGQPILPMMGGATPVEIEDDSGEEEEGSIEPQSPQPIAESPPQHHSTKPKFTKPKPVHPHPTQPMVQTIPQQYIQQQQPGMSQPAFVQNLPVAQQLAVYQPQQQGFAQPQMQPQTTMGQFPAGQPPIYNPQYQQQPEQLHTQSADKTPPDTQILPVLTENRQQTTELRISMGKVSDKVDRILEKVESMQNQQNGQLSLQSTQPNMEASVLMHNVQRIVQENDRLRKDGYDKSSKIESLNNKISELLQTNQQFVEKSQTLIEQRNEGFISTASQSQARVLSLEQEKVQLTTELANATSLYSNLQLEVTNLRKKEIEYQQKMGVSSNDSVRLQEELESLKNQKIDDSQKITELSTNFKEERQRRKHFESQISQIQEEFNDIKSSKESLEKNLSDRKRKATEEKRAMEEEFEENKEQLEREIQTLRDKLRKAKSSTDVATAEQVSQVEEELNTEWKEKCDKMMTAQQEKHKRALQEIRQENEELQTNVQQLEKKIQEIKSSSGGTESQITELQEQIEEMTVWKDKYENLRNQATGMKDKYEDRINELESERDQMEEERDDALERAQKQQEVRVPSSGDSSSQSVVGEVKKIMNTVYQELKNKFDSDETYTGGDVLGAILNSIKSTTLKLVQSQSATPTQEVQEESEEESEDEDEEDEDQDGDQDEGVEEQEKKVVDQDEEEEESDEDEEDVKDNVEEEKNDVGKPAESELIQSENTELPNQEPQNIPEDLPEVSNEMENNIENDQSAASVVENTQENVPDVNSDKNVVKDEQEKESNHGENEIINETNEQPTADSNTGPNKTENSNEDKKNVDSDIGSKAKVDLSDFDIPKIEKNNKPVVPPAASMEPPPIFDEDTTEQNNTDSLFGDDNHIEDTDNHVEDTLGISFVYIFVYISAPYLEMIIILKIH
ncbi:FK506-binding protein 15-like isoform X4 [Mytilus californianus]|uniref:FK506-binding protein 15-like isoform X3 n=1 Tax=Mytilus californianus TaxID=6549 RepID=UPI00224697ED|nr:FK506-binding protein 15-like isoform X3 [Mytilus californianus]XP_052092896.1 FK506-binding protein 15-like isoform X4 [Mytilus californianus]